MRGGVWGVRSTETWQRSFHQEGTNFSCTPLCSLGLGCAAVPNTQPNVFVASARKGSFPLTESRMGLAGSARVSKTVSFKVNTVLKETMNV